MNLIPFFLMFVFMALRMPVGFAMGVAGAIGICMISGFSGLMSVLGTSPYRTTASFLLTTIPMFILMAEFASSGGLAQDLFEMARRWIGHITGGLAIATNWASAAFGAMSGSANACAAVMSRITIPEMLKAGYSRPLATGVVAMAGTLDPMIPPSVLMVIYGIATETSIGKLLIAGILPGILTACLYAIGIYLWVKIDPSAAKPIPRSSWKERFESLRSLGPLLVLFFVVIGGMYFGVATPSEAAAFGAVGAFVICILMRRLNWEGVIVALRNTVNVTVMIFTIVIGAMIFGYYLTLTQVTQELVSYVGMLAVPRWVILVLIVIMYVILGALLDELGMLMMTLPLTFPLMMHLGYDPIWFGVIIVALCEVGMVCPPVGMTVFVVNAVTKIPLEEIYKGTLTLLVWEFIALTLLILFPEIALFLPSRMGP